MTAALQLNPTSGEQCSVPRPENQIVPWASDIFALDPGITYMHPSLDWAIQLDSEHRLLLVKQGDRFFNIPYKNISRGSKLHHVIIDAEILPLCLRSWAFKIWARWLAFQPSAAREVLPRTGEQSFEPTAIGSRSQAQGGISRSSVPSTKASGAQHPGVPEIDVLLAQLNALIGIQPVKTAVRQQIALLEAERRRRDAGLTVGAIGRHLLFLGNPGTGKTSVARLLSEIYAALGALSKGHLIEVDKSDLTGEWLGQTATKTMAVIESALGGVLFIDEAYSLRARHGDLYAAEAIDTLVKQMEDHRNDLVVIAAGYPDLMQEFMDSNPGLRSRFSGTINFPDYTDDELIEIFQLIARQNDYDVSTPTLIGFRRIVAKSERNSSFGNARTARSIFETARVRQAERLQTVKNPSVAQLRRLEPIDLPFQSQETRYQR